MQSRWLNKIALTLFLAVAIASMAVMGFASQSATAASTQYPIIHTPALTNPDVSFNEMLTLINGIRKEHGKSPLTISSELNNSAQLKANDMAEKGYWGHTSPDGATPWAFFHMSGYDYTSAGENLAEYYETPKSVVDAWYASTGHRATMLGDYTDTGFGEARTKDGYLIIVNHFGDEQK